MFIPIREIIKDAKKIIGKYSPRISYILSGNNSFASGVAFSLLARTFNSHSSDFYRVMADILRDDHKEEKLQALDEAEGCWLINFAKDINSTSLEDVVNSLSIDPKN